MGELTIMVNNLKNISAYQGEPPANLEPRIIASGPLYESGQVLQLLAEEQALKLWTRKSQIDVQRMSMDREDIADLVKEALMNGTFLGSEWCYQKPAGPVAACDAYRLSRLEYPPNSRMEMRFDYYVKFALSRSGTLLLIVSCHLSEDRR
jgi:hypothetical protein